MVKGFAADSTVEWAYEEFSHLAIKCGRVLNRFIRTMSTLAKKPNESIACASSNRAEAKAIYRLLGNDLIEEEVILAAHKKATISRMTDSRQPVILCIQDTTEFNYTSHQKTTGLGDGTKKNSRGLITHTAIAVTPSGVALGILDQKTWARDPLQRGKSNERQRPIEEKESYKWLKSMHNSSANMPKGITIVTVCDREADVYEFFCPSH